MLRIITGSLRVAREGLRRAWNLRLAATVSTVVMQLAGLCVVSYGAYLAWKPLGFLVGGALLVWLGNGLEPEPAESDNGPGED